MFKEQYISLGLQSEPFTVSEIQTEPVERWVQVSSIQHTALHGLLDVLGLKLELLQGCIQILPNNIWWMFFR